jgi:hypothetical protein
VLDLFFTCQEFAPATRVVVPHVEILVGEFAYRAPRRRFDNPCILPGPRARHIELDLVAHAIYCALELLIVLGSGDGAIWNDRLF